MRTPDMLRALGVAITWRRDGGGFAVKHNCAAVGRGRSLDRDSPAAGQRACFVVEGRPLSRMVGHAPEASSGKLTHLLRRQSGHSCGKLGKFGSFKAWGEKLELGCWATAAFG